MKVLLAYNPYHPKKPKQSGADMMLKGSFEAAFHDNNEHSYEVLYLGDDDGFVKDAKSLNDELLKRDFDICVVSEESCWYVYLDTAKKLGKKLFLCVWDIPMAISTDDYINFRIAYNRPRGWGGHINPHSMAELSQYCNIQVAGFGYEEFMPNIYGVVTSVDTRIFYPDLNINKDIDVSHNGSMYTAERLKFKNIFENSKIDIVYSGNNLGHTSKNSELQYSDYSMIFKKSKINLCFSQSIMGPNHYERKGRISEVASCASFLLMTKPEVMKFRNQAFFKEGIHFDSINEENCIEKVKFYLENDELREKIAKQFYQRFMEIASPKVYWENLFKWSK